jgi:hypothetical protein
VAYNAKGVAVAYKAPYWAKYDKQAVSSILPHTWPSVTAALSSSVISPDVGRVLRRLKLDVSRGHDSSVSVAPWRSLW